MKCTARRAGSTEQFFEVAFRALHKLAIGEKRASRREERTARGVRPPPRERGIENITPEQKQQNLLLNAPGVVHKGLKRLESSDGISPIFLPGILKRIDQAHRREALSQ